MDMPLRLQPAHVRLGDLFEARVTRLPVVAAVRRPVRGGGRDKVQGRKGRRERDRDGWSHGDVSPVRRCRRRWDEEQRNEQGQSAGHEGLGYLARNRARRTDGELVAAIQSDFWSEGVERTR